MRKFKLIRLLFVIAITAVLAGGLAAQNVNTPPTLQNLNLERVLDAKTILTTLTPNIPPAILAGVVAGALEVRESANFNPANQVLTVNAFTVQSGAPIPTPAANITSIFSTATMNVDKVYSSLTPRPSVMLAGTMVSNSPVSPYGNLVGAPAALSIGYTKDTPPKITDMTLLLAGSAVEFSAAAQGTLTFVQPPTPPGPTNTPQIVISSPTSVFTRIADLDASKTTSANPPLTFAWTAVAGNSDIARANSATALAYLIGGFGSYTFKVTVTDAKGNSSFQLVTINYF